METSQPSLPKLREGRYELREPIGKGGMASVFLAFDQELQTHRAIKVVTYESSADDPRRRRLRREARAMAQLCHPHVVQVFDIGSEGPVDYVVMELAPGGSLAEQLERLGPIPIQVAVGWALDVLSALSAAHAAGIVHRDVKPQNVLVDAMGRAMLADFGIALITDDEIRRTRTGVAMGSLAYMPPEQRLDAARVTHLADIYAVGSTLYRLLTHESAVDLFLADEQSPRWEGVPPDLAAVLRKACSDRPEHRYLSAAAFAEALAAWAPLGDRPMVTEVKKDWIVRSRNDTYVPTVGPSEQTARQRRISGGVLLGAGALLAALLFGALEWGSSSLAPAPTLVSEEPSPTVASEPLEPPRPDPAAEVEAPQPQPAPAILVPSNPPPTPEPASSEAAPPVFPLGTWTMNANGVQLTVRLTGTPEALVGTATSRMRKGRSVSHELRGRYQADRQHLMLREVDTGVRYSLNLDPGSGSGIGTVRLPDGGQRQATLTLSGPH